MSRPERADLLVIGGGTAGLLAAQTAAAFGARVVLVERDRTGGDCLWTGCVPSKSVIAAASLQRATLECRTLRTAGPTRPTRAGQVDRRDARIRHAGLQLSGR